MSHLSLNLRGRAGIIAAATATLIAVGGSIAYAAIPSSTDHVFTGCYSVNTGVLRLIDKQAGAVCKSGEKKVFWNQTGPQGARGDTGAAGPVGPQGPPGPTYSLGRSTVWNTGPINPSATSTVIATCPTGTIVMGGGYAMNVSYPDQVDMYANRPYPYPAYNAWEVEVGNRSQYLGSLDVYAICVKDS